MWIMLRYIFRCFVQAYQSLPGVHVHGVGEALNLVFEVGLFKRAKSKMDVKKL